MLGTDGRSFARTLCAGGVVVLLVLVGLCGVAGAVVPGPAWSVRTIAAPTNFLPGEETEEGQEYKIYVTNVGGGASDGSPITITDTLPPGVMLDGRFGAGLLFDYTSGLQSNVAEYCGDPCIYNAVIPPGDVLQLDLEVNVPASAPEGSITNRVTVTGGGVPAVSVSEENAISRAPAPFAIREFAFGVTGLDGTPDTQAGAHPYALSTSLGFTVEHEPGAGGNFSAPQGLKNVVTDLPLGLAGSALAAPECPLTDVGKGFPEDGRFVSACPADTRVGNVTLLSNIGSGNVESSLAEVEYPSALYNLTPERGHPVEFGFDVGSLFVVHLFASVVHTPSGYVLRVTSPEGASKVERPVPEGG